MLVAATESAFTKSRNRVIHMIAAAITGPSLLSLLTASFLGGTLAQSCETITMRPEIPTCRRMLPVSALSGKFGGSHVSHSPGDQFASAASPRS
jgi:hypothetical protein